MNSQLTPKELAVFSGGKYAPELEQYIQEMKANYRDKLFRRFGGDSLDITLFSVMNEEENQKMHELLKLPSIWD